MEPPTARRFSSNEELDEEASVIQIRSCVPLGSKTSSHHRRKELREVMASLLARAGVF